jgi:hypothetical protein
MVGVTPEVRRIPLDMRGSGSPSVTAPASHRLTCLDLPRSRRRRAEPEPPEVRRCDRQRPPGAPGCDRPRAPGLRRIFGSKDGFDDRDEIVPVDAIGHAIPHHGLAASNSVRQCCSAGPIDPSGPHDHDARKELHGKEFGSPQDFCRLPTRRGIGRFGHGFAVVLPENSGRGHQDDERFDPARAPRKRPPQAAQPVQVRSLIGVRVGRVRRQRDDHGVAPRKAPFPRSPSGPERDPRSRREAGRLDVERPLHSTRGRPFSSPWRFRRRRTRREEHACCVIGGRHRKLRQHR